MRIHHFLAREIIDKGPLLTLPCLRCEHEQVFHLYIESFGINLFGLKIALSMEYSLRCIECNYLIDLTYSDGQKALLVLPYAKMKSSQQISENEFEDKVQKLSFEFLKQIPSGPVTWMCPACSEHNPYTFSICWNCGKEHNIEAPDTSEFDLSHITGDKGANPYGPLNL
jgi:hypothetical protein